MKPDWGGLAAQSTSQETETSPRQPSLNQKADLLAGLRLAAGWRWLGIIIIVVVAILMGAPPVVVVQR